MLQLHGKDKTKLAGLRDYKDLCIEYMLNNEDSTLSFIYSKTSKYYDLIEEEEYIKTKIQDYVIKEKSVGDNYTSFKCILNLEDLEGKPWERFESEHTIDNALALAIAGTGWIVGKCSLKKKRTVRVTDTSSLGVVQAIRKAYRCDLVFNTLTKTIDVYEKLGEDRGTYFIDSLNLKSLDVQGNSYDYCTRIIPRGKDGLKISDVNNGKEYVENYQYSNKIKTKIWKDDRYTIAQNLKEDAEAKLEELSKPYRSYAATILNLAKLNDKYKDILDYKLGDTITLISKSNKFRDKQRIVKIVEYPDDHTKDTVELANTKLSFEEIQQEFQDAANTVSNITTDNGTVDGSTIDGIGTNQIKNFENEVVKVANIEAVSAKVNHLEAYTVTITGQITAVQGTIGTLTSNVANIDKLVVTHSAELNDVKMNKANVVDLNAVNAKINIVEANVGKIETLVNGNLSSENIQAGGITSDKLTIMNGFITNAMIANLDVSKVNAGDISTNKFRITSDSGNMLISDNTIQIRDNSRVRVQIGKDASNDYNMYVWDANGNLMFDATGLKAGGIKEKIIRDDMISDNANISGSKLNISSVVTSINNGSTTIKGSKVQIDGTNQTLDIGFNTLKTEVQGIQVGVRNLALKSNHPKFNPNNVGLGTSVSVSDKDGDFYRATPAPGKSISLYYYCKDSNVSKDLLLDGKTPYCISLEIRVSKDGRITRFNFEGNKSETIELKANTWTRIKAENIIVATNSNKALILALDNQPDLVIDYKFFKLEEGTKASNWTPAPEDSEKEIEGLKEITTTQSTTLTVMQGQIGTAINNTTITKDGQTILLKDDYNRTVQTVNSMSSTIGQHTTQISAQTGQITTVTSKVNTVERNLNSMSSKLNSVESTATTTNNKVSAIEQSLTNISARLSNTESTLSTTKSDVTQIKLDLKGITQKVQSVETTTTKTRKVASFRYIRDWLNGSTANSGNHTSEIQVWVGDTNIAKGKAVTTNNNDISNPSACTDGNTSHSPYTSFGHSDWKYIQLDLGSVREDIDILRVWHYWADGRAYNHKLEVSRDGQTWFELFNSEVSGKYKESSEGRTYIINESNTETRLSYAESKITSTSIIDTVSSQFYKKGETDSKYASQTQVSQLDTKITSKVETIENWQSSDTNRVINSKVYQSSNAYGFGYRDVMFERNKQYTLTVNGRVDQRALQDGKKLAIFIYNDDWSWSRVIYINSTSNINKSITFNAPDTGIHRVQAYMYPDGGSRAGEVTANWYKCVEGNRPSLAWSPAPEDINGRVDKHQSEIVQLSNEIIHKVDSNGVRSLISQSGSQVLHAFNSINPNIQAAGKFIIKNGMFEMYDKTNAKIMYVDDNGLISSRKGYATYAADQSGIHFLGNIIYHVPNKSNNYDNMYIESNKPIKFKTARSWDGIQGKDYQQIITSGVQLDGKAWDPSGIQGYILAADYELDTVVLYNQHKGLLMNIKARNAEFTQLTCTGAKNRIVETRSYGTRALNAVETCECYFEDRGRGKIANGQCMILIDPIFAETVNLSDYDISITAYAEGDIWVAERTATYFIVQGNSDVEFSYILYAKQKGFENDRLKIHENNESNKINNFLI